MSHFWSGIRHRAESRIVGPSAFGFDMDLYLKSHKEHWLRDKQDDGRLLILEDGSQWEVIPQDRPRTSRWLRVSTIIVEEPRQKSHYLLNNVTEAEVAHASYLGEGSKRVTEEAA